MTISFNAPSCLSVVISLFELVPIPELTFVVAEFCLNLIPFVALLRT